MFQARIIVIDDEKNICKAAKEILEDEGYEVNTFSNPLEALKHLESERYDVAILDLKMPDIDGMEVLKIIKEKYPDMIVVIITGYASVKTAVESIKLGAYDYVPKPFTTDELSAVVKKALENKKLVNENKYLQEELSKSYGIDTIVGESEAMKEIFELIKKVAQTDTDVLICGESGTGKELVARAIYKNSLRCNKKFVVIDCASLAQTLVETELFGYTKGAFTGATTSKTGLFEDADGGTVFLDEIANISLDVQAKLLRILQEKEFKKVGDTKSKKLNIRFISATNKDLEELIKEGKFREDLYYRLDVFTICIPPLRERKEDIPLLANYFLNMFSKRMHRDIEGFSPSAMNILIDYDWPGNVREMKNAIERLVIMTNNKIINELDILNVIGKKTEDNSFCNAPKVEDMNLSIPEKYDDLKNLKKRIHREMIDTIEKNFLINALNKAGWNITKASEITGILRPNFHLLMKKHNIDKK